MRSTTRLKWQDSQAPRRVRVVPLAAIAGLGLACVGMAAPAAADATDSGRAPTPSPGAMVGTADDWDGDVVYLTNPKGGRAQAVPTPGIDDPTDAQFDPLGQRIAISTWNGLWLAGPSGENPRLIPKTSGYYDFSWNPVVPDQLIATKGPSTAAVLTVKNGAIASVKNITFAGSGEARYTYSPDGTKVLATGSEAIVYNANGTGKKSLGVKGRNFVWGPDSTSVVFTDAGYDDLEQVPVAGGKPQVLVNAAFARPRGYDAQGRLLYTFNFRSELLAFDFRQRESISLGEPNIILENYSASPLAPFDLGSCDGLTATVTGTAGNDMLRGTAGKDIIRGLGGDDTIDGLGGDDIICGGDGNDILAGGDGADRIFGDAGADKITGGAGDDRVGGGAGIDRVDGGLGNDRVDGGTEGDTLIGGAGLDEIRGGFGDDQIDGGAGDDQLFGEPGTDVIHGGSGNDYALAYYRWNDGGPGETIYGDAGNDTLSQSATIKGGLGDDWIFYADKAFGEDGVDIIRASAWADGGTGDDGISSTRIQFGGAGDDHLTLQYNYCGQGAVPVTCSADGGDGHDTIQGSILDDSIIGGPGNDTISGDRGKDTIDGGTGIDIIHGGFDNDTLRGGDDADTIEGDSGDDLIYGDAGNDTLISGTGADKVYGGLGDDIISTFDGNDLLKGEAGNDRLTGGAGNDALDGGIGTDRCDGAAGLDSGVGCEIKVSIER